MALEPNKNTLASGTGDWTLVTPANAGIAIDDPPTRAPIGPNGQVVPAADYALFPTVLMTIDLKDDNNSTVAIVGDKSTVFPNPPDSIGFTAKLAIQVVNDTGHPLQGFTLGLSNDIPMLPYNLVPGVITYGEVIDANYAFFSQITPPAGQTPSLFDPTGRPTTPTGAAASTISFSGPIAPGASATTSSVVHNTELFWLNNFHLTVADTPASPHFAVTNTSNGQQFTSIGTPFPGPGLSNEFIMATPDNINVAAVTPMSFIQTGAGNDLIDVSPANGNNVLDGGTGTNLLIGGTGNDEFRVDTQGATASIWDVIKGFHAGDTALILGVASQTLTPVDNQGPLTGNTGLTWTIAGPVPTNVTLAGKTSADLAAGRLAVNFGNAAGVPFMTITETA